MTTKRDHGRDQQRLLIEQWLLARRCDLVDALSPCESPMEALLCLALLCVGDADGPFLRLSNLWATSRPWAAGRAGQMDLQHEVRVGGRNMRIDIAIFCGEKRLALEVDGHDFHAATPEQAKRDKSRDRLLTADSWTPVRFTGSELNADAMKCAIEVMSMLGLTAGLPAPAALAAAAAPNDELVEEIRKAEASGDVEAANDCLKRAMDRARAKHAKRAARAAGGAA